MEKEQDYSYIEPTIALETRIRMHKDYSTFSLEEFLAKEFNTNNKNVVDIGAGDGNFSDLFAKEASLYIGIEKNKSSIKNAYNKYSDYSNIIFINQDMDSELFLPNNTFDYVFFIYSSYYTNDARLLFSRIYKLLKKGGSLVLLGPHNNNAWEIDDFCYNMFNKDSTSVLRSSRINDEFFSILNDLNYNVVSESINFNLNFPNVNEYFLYIKSTLQYRNSFNNKIKLDNRKINKLLIEKYNLVLTKEIISLCAKK